MSEENNNNEEMTFDEYIDALSPQEKDLMVSAWILLNQSPRFQQFLDANYNVKYEVDEENKTVNLRVEELEEAPSITLTKEKLIYIHHELLNAGVKKGSPVIRKILNILQKPVQDESLIITDADFEQEMKDHEILVDIMDTFKRGN